MQRKESKQKEDIEKEGGESVEEGEGWHRCSWSPVELAGRMSSLVVLFAWLLLVLARIYWRREEKKKSKERRRERGNKGGRNGGGEGKGFN